MAMTLPMRRPTPVELIAFPGDETPRLREILQECKQGLPAHEHKLVKARELTDWMVGDSEKYIKFRPSEDALSWLTRPKRVSFITRQAILKLTSHLYKPGPRSRKFTTDDDVSAWYARVCQDINLDGLMQKADQLATLHGICAIGIYTTGNPRRPVNFHLFPRPDFALWTSPDDPRVAVAACTITQVDHETTRFRLFTRTHYYSFYRGKIWGYIPGGSTVARFDPGTSGEHPYGVLPFAFVTHELPTTELETEGLGCLLAKVNQALNNDKSNLALWVHHYARPLGFVSGVGPEWRPRFIDGGFVPLTVRHDSTEDNPVIPEARYLESSFDIGAVREYILGEANQALAEIGVPLTVTVQSDGGGGVMARSGLGIAALDKDLVTYAKDRQPLFTLHETALAALICRVGAVPYASSGADAGFAARLLAVADDPSLRVSWPEPTIDLPGPDRDNAELFELTYDLTDPIELLMRRQGLTEDEAIEHYRAIQRRKQVAAALAADPEADVESPTADVAEPELPVAMTEEGKAGGSATETSGDMGIAGSEPSPAARPAQGVEPVVSVTTVINPNDPIPAAPLILPATQNFGGWGTET